MDRRADGLRNGQFAGRRGSGWILGCLAMMAASLLAGCATTGSPGKPQPTGFVRPLPDTTEYVPLLGREEALRLHSGLVTLEPAKDCGWHSTEQYEEMIICLAGKGELRTQGQVTRPLAAGQYAYNPPHQRHCVFNTGTEPMRYIYVVTPTEP